MNAHINNHLKKPSKNNQKLILAEKIGKSLAESGAYNHDKTLTKLLEDSLKSCRKNSGF